MKYLKRFNEELNVQTYMSASRKLRKMGNASSIRRADVLKDWAGEVELKEYYKSWEEEVAKYSKYGKIRGMVAGEPIDFYFHITFDSLAFSDTFEDEKSKNPDNFDSSIYLMLWLAPTTKEQVDKCLENIPSDYFCNGMFQAFYLNIDMKIENDEVKFKEFNIYPEEEVGIELTPNAAHKLKETLIKLFSDKSFNYPSSSTDFENEYENMESCICIENGMSVDYGFELKDVADFITTIPKQKFMQ